MQYTKLTIPKGMQQASSVTKDHAKLLFGLVGLLAEISIKEF